jgi:hypothetical protein
MSKNSSQDNEPLLKVIVTEVRHEEAVLKAGALQNAILNSANFSSIATDAKGVIQFSMLVPSACWALLQMRF